MKDRIATNQNLQVDDMKSYYAFQAKIYDATRWTFLFGRDTILHQLPFRVNEDIKILEVGCGTGVNLRSLAHIYPKAELVGIDVSGDMLNRAEKNLQKYKTRTQLIEEPYEKGDKYNNQFDVILFSYSLTMINPQWKDLLEQAPKDLTEKGVVAVADFHKANWEFYRKFMRNNHVRLDGHILPYLLDHFKVHHCRVKSGLANVWEYMMFVGSPLNR